MGVRRRSKRKTLVILLTAAALLLAGGFGAVHFQLFSRAHQRLCRHQTWDNGVCASCGLACGHEAWTRGRCAVCGLPCEHVWENAVCLICGQPCEHPSYDHGVCTFCGTACSHDFREGLCAVCGEVCPHAEHDPVSQRCTVCGLKLPHSFFHGKCACGAEPVFYDSLLPAEFYQDCAHPGTVQKQTYIQKLHYQGDEEVTKNLNVYLPYGYTEQEKYNVLVLIHGQGDNEDDWLVETHESGGHAMCGRVILDNIFEQGLAEPCIVVTPVTETKFVQGLTAGIVQMQDELRETILPYIVEHYSTYAKDSSEKSLQEARSHFGLGGLSNGALFTYEGGMRKDFDLFGSYCAFSGNGEPWKTVAAIQEDEFAKLPVDCLFTGAGTLNDWQQNYTEIGFEYFLEKDERFVEGENAWRVDVEGGHEWKVWFTGLYNAMQVMFQSM